MFQTALGSKLSASACRPIGVQAYTARRAERALAEQAQEQHANEVAQQRNHDQAQAQIRRTERWVDDCCVPIHRALTEIFWVRQRFGEYHQQAHLHTLRLQPPNLHEYGARLRFAVSWSATNLRHGVTHRLAVLHLVPS